MNNYSLMSADRTTHLKIVVVSLIAGILVVGIGVAARPNLTETAIATNPNGKLQATGPVIRAGKPVAVSASDAITVR
jgi:hypothetical protein